MKNASYFGKSYFPIRLVLLFLFIGTETTYAVSTYSQSTRLSLNLQNTTIRDVFDEIEKNSEYIFFYYDKALDVNRKVSVNEQNQTVDKILDRLFQSTDNTYAIEDRQIFISRKSTGNHTSVRQQPRTITGFVTDEVNEPLIGVNIMIKGTTIGTITDVDGKFSLQITQSNPILIISYIGYQQQELRVDNRQNYVIIMKVEELSLNELVVVGYGVVKKKDLTGSVASVSSDKIAEVPATNAAQALQGRIAGVLINNASTEPGANPSVFIRGKRSISAGSDPLYVVDGIPITGGLNEISPTDIESLEVLKDASATAIYGARGSNGVVLITTKKGREGKTQVDYNGYVGVETVLNELEYMNGAEFAEIVRESYRSTGQYKSATPSWDEDQVIGTFKNDLYTLESIKMAYDANGNYDPSKVRSDSEWWKDIRRTGMVTNHQISIRGGSEKTQYSFGGTYFNEKGLMKDESYDRFSVRLSLDHKISKYFKVGGQTQYTRSNKERGAGLSSSWRVMPLGRYYDDDGNLLRVVSGTDDQYFNPLVKLEEGAVFKPYKVNRFFGSYYGEVQLPVDGLRFRTNIGLEMRSIQDYDFQSALSRNQTMNYAKNATENHFSYTWENLLYYDKVINDHSIGVTLLQSIQQYTRENNSVSVEGVPSDELKYYDVGSASTISALDSNKNQWQLASFMGRVNYGYKGRYLLTVSTRYDGSSRLAEGHKWVMFPAASAAWRLNDESFMQDFDALSNLKLRVGYGTVASSEVSPYETKGTLSKKYYRFGGEDMIGYAPNRMPNHSLTWETTGQWNVGLDFGFFNHRINGVLDLYLMNTDHLLLDRQLPVVSGFEVIKSNVGRTRNKGIELSLNTLNLQTTDFSWTTDWMFYANKEEIVELYNGKENDPGNSWFIGEAINVFYDYKKVGIWQDSPEDQAEMAKFNANGSNFAPGTIRLWDNGDYTINSDDRVIQGKARPDLIASINNTFQYKGFDLSFFFIGSFGSMIKNNIEHMNQSHRNGNVKVNYWTPSNPSNDAPRPIAGVDNLPYITTMRYEKADFIRLRNVVLGYTLPKQTGKRLDMSRCRIYVQAQNPWIWTNYTGVDPEGSSGYTRPSTSSWLVGLNVSF